MINHIRITKRVTFKNPIRVDIPDPGPESVTTHHTGLPHARLTVGRIDANPRVGTSRMTTEAEAAVESGTAAPRQEAETPAATATAGTPELTPSRTIPGQEPRTPAVVTAVVADGSRMVGAGSKLLNKTAPQPGIA